MLKLSEVEKYYKNVVKYGLDFKINDNIEGWDIVKELFNIAKSKLDTKDRIYLEPMVTMLKFKKTPADYLIDANIDNTHDLIEFIY